MVAGIGGEDEVVLGETVARYKFRRFDAVRQDHYPVRDIHDLLKLRGDDEYRQTLVRELVDDVEDLGLGADVYACLLYTSRCV